MARSTLKVSLGVLALAVLAGLGIGRVNADGGGMPPLNTVVVDRGDVSRRIVAAGTLQPVQTVTVGSQVSGNVDAVHVDFNSVVEEGQVIAQIDPSTFLAAVRAAEAELEAS